MRTIRETQARMSEAAERAQKHVDRAHSYTGSASPDCDRCVNLYAEAGVDLSRRYDTDPCVCGCNDV